MCKCFLLCSFSRLRYTTSRHSLRGVFRTDREGENLFSFRLMLIWERSGWFEKGREEFLSLLVFYNFRNSYLFVHTVIWSENNIIIVEYSWILEVIYLLVLILAGTQPVLCVPHRGNTHLCTIFGKETAHRCALT